ncbi:MULTISPECIES: VapE domain-containing protein [Leptolyngbya]|uniref:VapE domain-containing protein n=1 Tax=Leptolyngbya TaxID=47251 RepID=UPI0016899E5E|nr:VapE domain-containing protein [Leptolyngbya sp. FACHB-1624]MBD1859286.1 DUF3854 domain-containing protein [Leptolyngbya sp. FACHB-1624]
MALSSLVQKSVTTIEAIYCDGSGTREMICGCGVAIYFSDGTIRELGFCTKDLATNQIAELQAAIAAVKLAIDFGVTYPIKIYSDSEYVINSVTKWGAKYKQNGWKTSEGKPVANRALIEELHTLASSVPLLQWEWVKGHSGIEGNDRADRIAGECRKGRKSIDRIIGVPAELSTESSNPSIAKEVDGGELHQDPLKKKILYKTFDEFEKGIRSEFIEGSAIHPDFFDEGEIEIVSDTRIKNGEPVENPIAEFLGWSQSDSQAGFSNRESYFAALMFCEDGSRWQAKLSYQSWDSEKARYGKPYKAPKGNGSRAYLPPIPVSIRARISERYEVKFPSDGSFWDFVESHPEISIIVTEGGKKSLSAISQGYVTISLYGCNAGYYKNEDGTYSLIDDLKRFCQEEREFILAFDQDSHPSTQKRVAGAIRRMDTLLRSEADGIGVRVAEWDGAIAKGLDDLIVAQSSEAFDRAVSEAKGLLEKSTWIPKSCEILTKPPYNWARFQALPEFLKSVPEIWAQAPEATDLKKHQKAWLGLCGIHLLSSEFQEVLGVEVARTGKGLNASQLEEKAKELESIVFKATREILAELRRSDDFGKIAELRGRCVWAIVGSDKILSDCMTLVKLGDRLRFNTLKKQVELDGKPIQVGTARVELTLNESLQFKTKTEFEGILVKVAKRNSYSPIVEYLDRVSKEHGDSIQILGKIAERYFGQHEPIYNSMLKRFLISAVARAYNPGSKVDTALILQGKQGAGKSTFFKLLAGGNQYFDDSLGNVSDKDEKLKLHRVWFVEWAELETVFRRKDVASTKAFLSSSTDFVRPPYGRDTEEMLRSSVIVGTTNQDEFLSDSTGNRRFWVIPVLKDIDTELLEAERDRIWAAAVALYKSGEQHWLTDLEEVAASGIAEQFQTSDPWTDPVLSYTGDRDFVTTKEILDKPLQIEVSKQDKASQMRVAEILKKAGWQRDSKRIDGKVTKGWAKPELNIVQQLDSTEPRNPKNPDLPAWVTLNAIAVHKPTGTTFSIVKVPRGKTTGEYKLQNEAGEKYLLRECEPYRERQSA